MTYISIMNIENVTIPYETIWNLEHFGLGNIKAKKYVV